MASHDKCLKCVKIIKQGKRIKCYQCDFSVHSNCAFLSDDICDILESSNNLRWFCDKCSNLGPSMKRLTISVDSCNNEMLIKLDKLNDLNSQIKSEIDNINIVINANKDKLNQLDQSDVLRDELKNLKSEMSMSFASIVSREVKKNVEDINTDVKMVQKTLNDVNEMKERENNLIMFHLVEGSSDRANVLKILKHLSDDIVDTDIVKIIRLGKSKDNHVRPLLLRFSNIKSKDSIMKNVFKIKSLDENFNHIGISHDLTIEQRKELKTLVDEAKSLEVSNKDGFLFRVRGPVGKWKIVKFPQVKKTV